MFKNLKDIKNLKLIFIYYVDNDRIDIVKNLFTILRISQKVKNFIILDYIIEKSNITYFLNDT